MVADDDATTVRVRAIGSRPDERGSRWRKAHRRREREDRQHREARSSQRGVHRATVLAAGGDGGGAYSGEPGGASGGSRFSGCSRGSWEPWWWMFVAWQPREIDRVCQPPFAPSRRATVALAREPLSLSLSLYLSISLRLFALQFSLSLNFFSFPSFTPEPPPSRDLFHRWKRYTTSPAKLSDFPRLFTSVFDPKDRYLLDGNPCNRRRLVPTRCSFSGNRKRRQQFPIPLSVIITLPSSPEEIEEISSPFEQTRAFNLMEIFQQRSQIVFLRRCVQPNREPAPSVFLHRRDLRRKTISGERERERERERVERDR